jgi:hypothetical protein
MRKLLSIMAVLLFGIAASVVLAGPAQASVHYSCFGVQGTFKSGTTVSHANFNGGATDLCFGIAPDRTIWHIVPGWSSWQQRGNGLADATFGDSATAWRQSVYYGGLYYGRSVVVWVAPGSHWFSPNNSPENWIQCPPGSC